jgi:hypothetical protein
MDTEASPRRHRGGHPLIVMITSLCAAICMAIGLGIVFQAAIIAGTNLFQLGTTLMWGASAINAAFVLWLFLWTFARSWHVERRLREGLDVDEPKLSILANLKGY